MVPEFDAVVFSEQIGVVHGPVKTQVGYQIDAKAKANTSNSPTPQTHGNHPGPATVQRPGAHQNPQRRALTHAPAADTPASLSCSASAASLTSLPPAPRGA